MTKKAQDYDSRTAEKFVVRLPEGVRDQIKARAEVDDRSMNDVVVHLIKRGLNQSEEFDALLKNSFAAEAIIKRVLCLLEARDTHRGDE